MICHFFAFKWSFNQIIYPLGELYDNTPYVTYKLTPPVVSKIFPQRPTTCQHVSSLTFLRPFSYSLHTLSLYDRLLHF